MSKKQHPKTRGVYERIRGSGVWWIRWHDAAGRQHRRKIGPYELACVAYQKEKLRVLEGELLPGLNRNRIRCEELFDDFKASHPRYWASVGMLEAARSWFVGIPASALTPEMIVRKLNKMESREDEPAMPATLNRYRAIVSAVFDWAMRNGRAEKNPARLVRLRRENNRRVRWLDDKEEERLRKAILGTEPLRLPEMYLALHTGMRRGNQYSLTWRDIDFKNGVITLRTTKPGHQQHIPMNPDARAALESLRLRPRIAVVGKRSNCVCATPHKRWFNKAVKKAGIGDFRWHDLRHTFASRLVMKGANLRDVSELLGHASIQMTMRYAHLSPGRTAETVALLSQKPAATGTATGTGHFQGTAEKPVSLSK